MADAGEVMTAEQAAVINAAWAWFHSRRRSAWGSLDAYEVRLATAVTDTMIDRSPLTEQDIADGKRIWADLQAPAAEQQDAGG